MTHSLNGLGYELMELLRSTNRVTDSVDIRLLKDWVKQTRALLLKQRFDEPMAIIDPAVIQDLGKVTFAPIDSYANISVPSGKYMMRSSTRLPITINRKGNIGTFTRIAPADRLEKKFNLVSYERALVSGNGKFNSNDVYAFTNDGYMYLISKTNIHKYITSCNIQGVFVNPEDAYTFNTAVSSVTPWSDDLEYPVSESIVVDLQNIIIDKKFRLVLNQIEDSVANGKDDTTNITPRK